MRIIVITDVHANLPALQAVLDSIQTERYDAIFHTGDAIAIGPYPAECLDLMMNIPSLHFVKGNHEAYFVDGLPKPKPALMSDGEVQHQKWTHSCIDPLMLKHINEWPYFRDHIFYGVKISFVHYALTPSLKEFQPVVRDIVCSVLDSMFEHHDADIICYGHDHRSSDIIGRKRYLNPGSLGCYKYSIARFCLLEFKRDGEYTIEHRHVAYDDTELYREFERRRVPDRALIYKAFFGSRFQAACD